MYLMLLLYITLKPLNLKHSYPNSLAGYQKFEQMIIKQLFFFLKNAGKCITDCMFQLEIDLLKMKILRAEAISAKTVYLDSAIKKN